MKKILVILLSLTVVLIFIPSFADAASITASISTQVGGVDVNQAVKGTTIQLVSSCIIDPSVPITGTVSYQYSADGVIWTSKTTVTAYPSWDGAQQTTDFVLADSGSYIFYIDVTTEGAPPYATASQFYPSAGVFTSEEPPNILPESPPIAALLMGIAAFGLFLLFTRKSLNAHSIDAEKLM